MQETGGGAGVGSRLETVIMFTGQMDELARFYKDGFDLDPYNESPGHLGQQLGHVYIGFDQVDEIENSPPSAVTLWFTVDDIQQTFDRLVALGARVSYPPQRKPWGATLAAVFDPDGNLLGLAQREPT